MKNTFRALFGVSALAFLLVATPVLAAEVDVTAENTTTGADSTNRNDHDVDHDIDVDVTNDGNTTNSAVATANTGKNDQKENTTGGDLESGTVEASTDWENVLNAGTALAGMEDGLTVDADFGNDTTGADSDNINDLDVDHNIDLDLDNVATIVNALSLNADTGHNEQERNTTAGDLMTGNVEVDAVFANWANTDSGFAGAAAGETSINVEGRNHLTGADSTNRNDVDVDNDYDVDVENDATIVNSVVVTANTGKNDQKANTTAGSIETGNVDVSTNVANSANNGTSMSNLGNNLEVTVNGSNDTTGADSTNRNTTNVNNNVDVAVTNDAAVTNVLVVDGDSGHNEQERNTTGGNISTGGVKINFDVTNVSNSND